MLRSGVLLLGSCFNIEKMSLRKIFKKILYYRNVRLLAQAMFFCIAASLKKSSSLADIGEVGAKNQFINKEKVVRYVNLCLRVKNKLGFKNTCFISSMALSRALRKMGYDAKVSFGAKKESDVLKGHCWVTVGNEVLPEDYETIFKYPFENEGSLSR